MERRYEEESGVGLRRRRDGASFTPIVSSGEPCNNGGASAIISSGRSGVKTGSGRVASRPAAIFLAQALLSFIGIVVIPTRLAFDLLVQPRDDQQAHGPPSASPSAIFSFPKEGRSVTTPAPHASPASSVKPLVEEMMERGRHGHGDSVSSVLVSRGDTKGRTGARVLMQAGSDEESYTYNANTQFNLCAFGVTLEMEALSASLVDVLDLEEAQVCWEFVHTTTADCVLFLG